MENDQIILLDTGEYTRYNAANNSFFAIALSIKNSTFTSNIVWSILTEYSSSDHWPISINILNQSSKISNISRWNLNNLNWELYSDVINQELIDNPINHQIEINQTRINSIIDHFSDIILDSANKTIGKLIKKLKIVPWWNKKCNTTIKTYKISLYRFF